MLECFQELDEPDPNFLVIYDLKSGYLFKKWKADYSATAVAISSLAGVVISGHEDGGILVWDLVGGHLM